MDGKFIYSKDSRLVSGFSQFVLSLPNGCIHDLTLYLADGVPVYTGQFLYCLNGYFLL